MLLEFHPDRSGCDRSSGFLERQTAVNYLIATFFFIVFNSFGTADERREVFETIPGEFPQVQDGLGFLWQISETGAITSGKTQYLPSGLKLIIDEKGFSPEKGSILDESVSRGEMELILTGKAGDFTVERNILIDLNRGGGRAWDTVRNPGSAKRVKIELRTAFQFPWQNLVGSESGILGDSSVVKLDERDSAIVANFSVAEGRQDAVILFGDRNSPKRPMVSASSNARELVLTYEIEIPAQGEISLLHWMARRNFGSLGEIPAEADRFLLRNSLIDPGIPFEEVSKVANFSSGAFPRPQSVPPNIGRLVVLNELLERRNLKRTSSDMIIFSSRNRVEGGRVAADATVKCEGLGWPVEEVAAISGGGGEGRIPRVYLRDGSVHRGEVEIDNFVYSAGEDWSTDTWDPEGVDLLLFGLGAEDGSVGGGTVGFIEFQDGRVSPVTSIEPPLRWASAGGQWESPLGELESILYLSDSRPQFRISLRDGTNLGGVPVVDKVKIETGEGDGTVVNSRSIRRFWKVGDLPAAPAPFRHTWLSGSEIPRGLEPGEPYFLLRGNQVFPGRIVEGDRLNIIDGRGIIAVEGSRLAGMRWLDQGGSDHGKAGFFELELGNGESFVGRLRESFLSITDSRGETRRIPVRQILEFRGEEAG